LYWRHTETHFLLREVKETATSSPSSRYPLLDLEGLEETSVCDDISSKNTLHLLWSSSYKIWTMWRPREIRIVFFLLYLFLGAFAKLGWATISFVVFARLSGRPHRTTRLPLEGFSWNLTFGHFSKICWACFTFYHIPLTSAQRRKCFRLTKRNSKHTFYFVYTSFLKSCRLWDNVE
jgi:hypothetical protein